MPMRVNAENIQINISCGETGGQKTIDVEDEKILYVNLATDQLWPFGTSRVHQRLCFHGNDTYLNKRTGTCLYVRVPSRNFYDQRIAAEVDGDAMGEDFAGYIFR